MSTVELQTIDKNIKFQLQAVTVLTFTITKPGHTTALTHWTLNRDPTRPGDRMTFDPETRFQLYHALNDVNLTKVNYTYANHVWGLWGCWHSTVYTVIYLCGL